MEARGTGRELLRSAQGHAGRTDGLFLLLPLPNTSQLTPASSHTLEHHQPEADVEPGMKIVDGRYGLPQLPSVDFSLIWSEAGKTECACRFGQLVLEMPEPS